MTLVVWGLSLHQQVLHTPKIRGPQTGELRLSTELHLGDANGGRKAVEGCTLGVGGLESVEAAARDISWAFKWGRGRGE